MDKYELADLRIEAATIADENEAAYIRWCASQLRAMSHAAGPFHGTVTPVGSLTTITR